MSSNDADLVFMSDKLLRYFKSYMFHLLHYLICVAVCTLGFVNLHAISVAIYSLTSTSFLVDVYKVYLFSIFFLTNG